MIRPGFLAEEVWTGLRRSLSMAISVLLVTMVSVVFLGIGLLANRQVEAAKGYWYDRVEVSIFLCTARSTEPDCAGGAATSDQQQAIGVMLQEMRPIIDTYEFESQGQAYARFLEQFGNNPTFADTPKEAIPAAFRVKLTDPTQYPLVHDAFTGMPGVATVRDIREVLDPLFRALDVLKAGAWGLAGIMLVCAVLLVSTTVRQVAWARRRETGIKRIVGASMGAIRLPFVIETLLATFLGCAVAVVALWTVVQFGVSRLADRFRDFAWVTSTDVWAVTPILLAITVVLSVVVSWLAVTRHVRL